MSLETIQKIIDSGVKLTPMMEQYYQIKKQYPDMLLLYRMGDFYELFFDDARDAARILNISLTHRGKLGDTPIPMSGIPHHAASTYIDRITARGLKAAICEQVEDPKEAKGIVKRAVTQVVSPGMPYDLDKTEKTDQRFMASALYDGKKFYLINLDFTTGEFKGSIAQSEEEFINRVRLIGPREFICYIGQWENFKLISEYFEKSDILLTHLSEDYFSPKYTEIYTEKLIPSFKHDKIMNDNNSLLAPIGALSYYVTSTQGLENIVHLRPFRLESETGKMGVTLPTLIGLEILPKSRDRYSDSLLGFFDRTKTAMGSRKLKDVFQSPLRSKEEIVKRQDLVQYFIENNDSLEFLRGELAEIRDLERIMAKVSTGKVNAGDLLNLSKAVFSYRTIMGNLQGIPSGVLHDFNAKELKAITELADVIKCTLNDEIGAALEKGNLIKSGCHPERDRLAGLSTNWANELMALEMRYKEETGIPKLKIKSNNVAGYFIEVTKSFTKQIPDSFQRRQTLVNSERYVTDELVRFEKEVLSSKEKLERLEREIFKGIVKNVSDLSYIVLNLSTTIGLIDVFHSFSWIAIQEELTRPEINEKKKVCKIAGGWHPLIKSIIKDQFVTHDISLDENNYFGLITGPNMAGKTTVMREIAIIQLLTQVGSFVPAESAEVGLCDYLFSRLGASDDILQGQSTFMVEMSETAEIIRHATDRSLIILDEVGRGTSTYDGLSIAWALVEHFIKNTKAITLFATHYHELIELVDGLRHAKNFTVETVNKGADVQFLYRLIEQGASQSFGIYVAKLAGLPKSILERSSNILKTLEEDSIGHNEKINKVCKTKTNTPQMSIFDMPSAPVEKVPEHLVKIKDEIDSLDVMGMTPLDALNKLNELKKLLN